MSERAAKQPRQSDFDRSSFTQPPPKPADEPVMPIHQLIPNRVAEERAAQAAEVRPAEKSEKPTPAAEPSPASTTKPAEDAEPPKEKISVMLPAAMVERLKDAAFWERMTVASIVERGLIPVLANLERKNGGAYEKRNRELKPGRPAARGSKNGEKVKR
jgi:hypothetical protein